MFERKLTPVQRAGMLFGVIVGLICLVICSWIELAADWASPALKAGFGALATVVLLMALLRTGAMWSGRLNVRNQPQVLGHAGWFGGIAFAIAMAVAIPFSGPGLGLR